MSKTRAARDTGQPTLGAGTILLVEDEQVVRNALVFILRQESYRVLAAESPVAAERLFEGHAEEIDLLISDVVMPGSNGPEMYRRLAVKRPSLKVLFMSGYAARAFGADGLVELDLPLLQKPFSRDTLLASVRDILKRP